MKKVTLNHLLNREFCSKEIRSYPEEFMNNFSRKLSGEASEITRKFLVDKLSRLGYNFNSENEFLDFLKARVYRIGFNENPQYYEFYLDYVNVSNPGTYVGSYSESFSWSVQGNTCTGKITIGVC